MQRHYFGATRGFIQDLCKHCPVCQLSAPQTNRPPLKPIIEREFLSRVQIDLIDMRHSMDGEYAYIGHFVDHFSKFNVLFPLKTKTADEVSTLLEERVLAYLGPPKIFHSDNGREFVNQLIRAMFDKWGGNVTFINGRPRHSQSQGLVERGNRTIEDKLKAMKKDEGLQGESYPWASWLPRIMWALNSQRHETIKYSPYHLLFCKQPPAAVFPGTEEHCVNEEDISDDVHISEGESASPTTTPPVHSSSLHANCDDDISPVQPPSPRTVAPPVPTPRRTVPPKPLSTIIEEGNHTSADQATSAAVPPGNTIPQSEPLSRQDAIRKRALDNTYKAATSMSNFYNRKKRKTACEFNVGDRVSLGIPKLDRTSTDLPRLPCVVIAVHGEKVLSYSLATEFGRLEQRFRAGDLMTYTGTVDAKQEPVLSVREAAKLANPENKFLKSSCNCRTGCKTSRCSCRANKIACSTHCHQSSACTNSHAEDHQEAEAQQQPPLLTADGISVLNSDTAWLNDNHILSCSQLLKSQFPHVDGLQDTLLQSTNTWSVPSGEYVQVIHADGRHWLTITNMGETELCRVRIYDSLRNTPTASTMKTISNFLGVKDNHLRVSVMNVQQQPNSNDCGLYAVAFATALAYGQDPTEQDYVDLRSHFLTCVLSRCLTPFPSSVAYRKPKELRTIEPSFCSCGRGDDGSLMIECEECGEWFHSECVGKLSKAKAKKWRCSRCMQ